MSLKKVYLLAIVFVVGIIALTLLLLPLIPVKYRG